LLGIPNAVALVAAGVALAAGVRAHVPRMLALRALDLASQEIHEDGPDPARAVPLSMPFRNGVHFRTPAFTGGQIRD
jgi:hypothetical protein